MTPDLPRPHTDANTHAIINNAIHGLAVLRHHWTPAGPDLDPGHALHLLASLNRQTHNQLPDAIEHAHRHGYTWTHIRILLDN